MNGAEVKATSMLFDFNALSIAGTSGHVSHLVGEAVESEQKAIDVVDPGETVKFVGQRHLLLASH